MTHYFEIFGEVFRIVSYLSVADSQIDEIM